MQSINNTTNELNKISFSVEENRIKKRITNERQYILSIFLEEINKERIGTRFKPMTGRGVAMKLGHLKDNHTLYYFLSECRDYKNRGGAFSKRFFGSLKVK